MRIPVLDATDEPPDRGSIGDVGAGRRTLRLPRVEEANHATEAIEDKRARISLAGERARLLIVIVNREFDGLDGTFIAKEGLKTRVTSDGEVGSGPVLKDDQAGLAVAVEYIGVGEKLLGDDAADPQLTILRILESRPTVALRVHHRRQFLGRYRGS